MNNQWFALDDVSSMQYGICLQKHPEFEYPVSKTQKITVAGRNGDLLITDNSYGNIQGTLSCYVLGFQSYEALAEVNDWLCKSGYRRFTYDGDPVAFRMVRVTNGAECSIRMKVLAPFEITLDCKPQRFLFSGENPIVYTTSGILTNPALSGLPYMKVYGTGGYVTINNKPIQISTIDGYIEIDCELQDAFKGGTNCNSQISCSEFPVLENGTNTIQFGDGVTRVELTPRWFTL